MRVPFVVLAAVMLAGCPHETFVVDVTVERGSVPLPDRVDFTIVELSDGATLDTRMVTVVGSEFFATPGESNRLLVIAGEEATALTVTANAFDALDVEVGSGMVSADRAPGTQEVLLTLTAPFCGDALVAGVEECDGADLAGETCASRGFVGGTLGCDGLCRFDTSACNDCGDGEIDGGEECDGPDVGPNDCTTLGMGFLGGTLACATDCSFDVTGCTAPANCGNDLIEPGEDCDGTMLGGTCGTATMSTLPEGTLACFGGCVWDITDCYLCGNGLVEGPETCDGADLAGADCVARGYQDGALACATDCLGYDETGCTVCGDSVTLGSELCDGSDTPGADCVSEGFDGGTLTCNGTCDGYDTSACVNAPSVPVLRKPMNNSYVGSVHVPGSRRPSFVWEASSGAGTITYELEYATDPTFAAGVTLEMPATTTFQPASDLAVSMTAPVGDRYYWRVRACSGGACSANSDVWWVNVGRATADYNGDGYADLAVGAPPYAGTNIGKVYVYFGGPGALDTTADGTMLGVFANDGFGTSVAAAGDLNGDGFADLAVDAIGFDLGVNSDEGRVYIYFGAPGMTFDTTPDGLLDGENPGDLFGGITSVVARGCVAGAGDVNADGFDDLIVGAPSAFGQDGAAWIFEGGPGAVFDSGADAFIPAPSPPMSLFGWSVTGAGDLNGDGYADVVAGGTAAAVGPGVVYAFFGGSGAFDVTSDGTLASVATYDNFGYGVAGGDLNGDGFSDVVVGLIGWDIPGVLDAGQARVYFGGPGATLDAVPEALLESTSPVLADHFGSSVSVGDLNGDGLADVAVGGRGSNAGGACTDCGEVRVFFGGTSPLVFDSVTDGVVLGAGGAGDRFAYTGIPGDLNGDGYLDLAVGAPFANTNTGYLWVFSGGAGTSFDTMEDATLVGELTNDGFGLPAGASAP